MHKAITIGLIGLMILLGIQQIKQEHTVEEVLPVVDYLSFTGTITEVREGSILVQEETNEANSIVFHISDNVLLLSQSEREQVANDAFEVGQKVTAYYPENAPMALSLPPQVTPSVLVLNSSVEDGFVHVATFDNTLTSSDGRLKIILGAGMTIVDRQGKTVTELANKTLVVFYRASTRSIPAQTTPDKIIVL